MKLAILLCALFACALADDLTPVIEGVVEAVPFEVSQEAAADKVISTRIANGHAAAANQFPYQVSVLTPAGAGVSVCGGSLISNAWVFTAAHCTQGSQVNLRFGSINLWSGGVAQTSFQLINHPQYNPINLNNDVSLVRIPSPVALGAGIQPIRLPTAAQVSNTFLGVQATVSGWGGTGVVSTPQTLLRWVQMRVISNAQCQQTFGSSAVVPHVVCALGYVNPANQGHCGGDSGGPLALNEGGINTLIGVVSFGARAGCHLGFPHGYMRSANFVHWVASHTGIAVR